MAKTLTSVRQIETISSSMDCEISEAMKYAATLNGNLRRLRLGKTSLKVARERIDGTIARFLTSLRESDLQKDVRHQINVLERQKRILNFIKAELLLEADENGSVAINGLPSAQTVIKRMRTVKD